MIETLEWARHHKDSPIGSCLGSNQLGWQLWRPPLAPFPRTEMGPGFQYYICDRPPGGIESDEEIVTRATVEEFMRFRLVTDLEHAHRVAVRRFGTTALGSLASPGAWLTNGYNLDAVADGRFNPPARCHLAMWTYTGEKVDPPGIGKFELGSHRKGWKRL
jgi:hypothetical protein